MIKRLLICSFSLIVGITLVFIVFSFQPAQPAQASTSGNTCYVSYSTGTDVEYCCDTFCRTIQYAINMSSYGDSIQVDSGTYAEHITMKNGVSVYGRGWDYTIIDGGFTGPTSTVYIPASVSASTVFSGFKVMRGGWGYPSTNTKGGGLQVYGSANIVNTWVYSNTASLGGGVYVGGGSPTFNNVPVWNNYADHGGGFYIQNNAVVNIYGNPLESLTNGTVLWNKANGSGGGFYLDSSPTVTLLLLRIYWNSTEENGGGLYIGENTNKITLWGNDISGNHADMQGGGMRVWKATNLDLFLNFIGDKVPLVGGNRAGSDGGGVFFLYSAGNVHNNWFYGNSTEGYGGAAAFCYASPSPGLIFSGNWLEGNSADYHNGGGLSIFYEADPQIDANTIISNTATRGGGINLSTAGEVKITNNIIARNVSTAILPAVGGIEVFTSPVQIKNNTIADNTGDGVWFDDSDSIAIVNNIIYGNSLYSLEGDVGSGTSIYTVAYNDRYANMYNNYNGVPTGAGDLSINPQFKASGDFFQYYHLLPGSPVNTTGSPTWAPPRDIDNQERPCAGAVSMGADQLCFPVYLPMLNR